MLPVLPLAIIGILALADPYLAGLPPVAWSAPARAPDEIGITSRYGGPGDGRYGGQALACAPQHHVAPGDHVCAHRTHRCGTILLVESVRTGRRTLCRVMDRGPYGAIDAAGAWHVEVRLQPGSRRRGILDMTPAAFGRLGLRGLSPVRTWVVSVPARPLRVRPTRRPAA